jgi:putative glutamine amidotransferase
VLPAVRLEHVPRLVDRLDGVVFSGGVDVDPGLYGQAPHAKLGRVNRLRDEFELALAREALRRNLPILGICRGLQLLNVAMGGTLLQHIPSEWKGAQDHDAPGERWHEAHDVRVVGGTRLRDILGRDELAVNSLHHQAVDRLGADVVASAFAADGIVEGIELPQQRFALGVQWHPESFWNRDARFQSLFDAHVGACRP